jgi:hypothetical protein
MIRAPAAVGRNTRSAAALTAESSKGIVAA